MGLRTAAALACAATLTLASSALASPHSHGPIQDKHQGARQTSSSSSNWSGYDVIGSGATDVTGTWIQPAATCTARRENSWSSPWVGIDGDSSSTVEQIGTDSDCRNGLPFYYAWYEMYPKGLVQIPASKINVTPGDTYTAHVSTTGQGVYTLTLTHAHNGTTVESFIAPAQTNANAQNASIEWIMEGPSNGTLTNFGSVGFTAASGSINGSKANTPVASFGDAADAITMVGKRGVIRALPGNLLDDAFSVEWKHG